jgi:histidine kinase/DNA gyrase B/HSP90-like ATPase/FecR-like protein
VGELPSRASSGAEPQRRDSDLVAPGLVHELRQSVTGLDAGLKLLERALGPAATQLDAWSIATTQLARLRETLDTYEQLMSSGVAEPRAFAVEPVVRRAVESVRFRLEGARDRVTVTLEPGVPPAWGDPRALLHALTNLLSNALDAVAETGAPGRIEIRALRAGGEGAGAQVRVADAGTGVAPEHRHKVFEPRFTTKAAGRGSGLGLAIARRMLRRSGGELRLGDPADPARRPWASTEFVVDLAAGRDAPALHAPPSPRRRALAHAAPAVAVAVTLLAVVGAGWVGFQRWILAGDPPSPSIAAPVADAVEVLEVVGQVERLRGGAWKPLAAHDGLEPDDTLRTGVGARATVAIGERSRLAVADATQLTVREITAAVQRLRLSRGRISVDHQPDGGRVLVVESEGGDAVARAGAARFSVLASRASLAVATEAGAVRLQSAGESVDVAAGQQSVAFRGRAPREAAPVPVALLLRVGRMARAANGTCTIEGVAAPGAEVRVDGRLVEPGPAGTFSVRVPVEPGGRTAAVETRDAAGRVVQRRVACVEQGVSDFAVRWGQDALPSPAP